MRETEPPASLPVISLRPGSVSPVHGAHDSAKLANILDSMRTSAWIGRPLLVIESADGYQALTGSHRIAAARLAKLEVRAVVMSDEAASICREEGTCWDERYDRPTDPEGLVTVLRTAGYTVESDLLAQD